MPWIALAPLLACASACGAPADGEPTASSASAIYGGVEDNTSTENQAVVALKIGDGATTFLLCSGSLIAPDVVLTARHCVSAQPSTSITCDQNGVSSNPSDFGADVAPATIHVFTSPTPALLGTAAANGKALFHPAGTTLCNLDVALIVLDAPIAGIAPLPVRLTGPATTGESLRAVGYGENDQNAPIGTRFRKDGVTVLAVGSTISSSQTPLGSSEFEVGESMCEGDSGGPVIDETTGAIVGIVSRGGACADTTGHVYTSVAGFTSVFQEAFAMAGGAPIAEGTASATVEAGAPPPTVGMPEAGTMSSPAPGPTSGDAPNPSGSPVNLRSGEGKGCSIASAPEPRGSSLAVSALVLALMLALARARRGASPALCSGDGRRTGPAVR